MTPTTPGRSEPILGLWPKVVAFARQLGCADAADVAQEAYLKFGAYRSPPADERGGRALLFTIVLNLVRSRSRRKLELRLEDDSGAAIESTDGDPVAAAIAVEDKARLGQALAALQPAWRAALFLADGLDCSYAEVAAVLGTSEDVVRTTLHRARRRLRAMLDRSLPERTERSPR